MTRPVSFFQMCSAREAAGPSPRLGVRHWAAPIGAAIAALVLSALPAGAHEAAIPPGTDPWTLWPFAPEIILGLALAAVVYLAGTVGRPSAREAGAGLRHAAFFGGLVALFAALLSPIEPLADHSFIVHQVEHMLLRTVGPALLMAAAPQAALIRGLPGWAKRRLVTPVMASGAVRRVFAVLSHPVVATMLFVGTSWFWMLPGLHDIAILDEPVHYSWHLTLLLSGLLFFWRIFDPRPYPHGASLPQRLAMFWFAAAGNILLGVYLSFKAHAIYTAYDVMGRFWPIAPVDDERYGGLTMWIPGTMMLAMAALIVVYRWLSQEDRMTRWRAGRGGEAEIAATDFVAAQRPKNRALAVGLATFAVFVGVIATFAAIAVDEHWIGS